MADYKKSSAASTTVTQNLSELENRAGNVYEVVMILAKRANQIGAEMKQELNRKLEEFAYYSDNLEEVFENREQIEISRYYERLPKPTLIALQEFIDDEIYVRLAEEEQKQDEL